MGTASAGRRFGARRPPWTFGKTDCKKRSLKAGSVSLRRGWTSDQGETRVGGSVLPRGMRNKESLAQTRFPCFGGGTPAFPWEPENLGKIGCRYACCGIHWPRETSLGKFYRATNLDEPFQPAPGPPQLLGEGRRRKLSGEFSSHGWPAGPPPSAYKHFFRMGRFPLIQTGPP